MRDRNGRCEWQPDFVGLTSHAAGNGGYGMRHRLERDGHAPRSMVHKAAKWGVAIDNGGGVEQIKSEPLLGNCTIR